MNQMTPGRMAPEAAAPRRAKKKPGLEIAFDPEVDPLAEAGHDPFPVAGTAADMGPPSADDVASGRVRPASPRTAAGPRVDPASPPPGPNGDDVGGPRDAAAGRPQRHADPAAAARALGIPVPLAKIEVTVSVEVGRTRLSLADLVSVEPGELVALDRMTNAPVDVLVNGKPFARGEIVAIGDRFGVRLTELLDTGDLA